MARVLVTGANGQIGCHTIRSLLRRQYEVIPFVRPTSDLRGLQKLGLEYRFGDVMDYPSLAAAAGGCDVIIHLAAVYRVGGKHPEEIMQPAMIGTQNVFRAAKENGVRRLVYTSSVAAVGSLPRPRGVLTEADWNPRPLLPYMVAKTQSERLAVRLSEELGIPTVRLCPTTVCGPYDYRISPSNAPIRIMANGEAPTVEGGNNYVHAYDVGEAHAAAVERGEPGGRYIVGGAHLHVKEVAAIVAGFTGETPKHIGLPRPLFLGVVALGDMAARVRGREPRFDSIALREVYARYNYYDCSLGWRTFGLTPRGPEEVVADTLRWLLFLGKLRPEVAARLASWLAPDPDW